MQLSKMSVGIQTLALAAAFVLFTGANAFAQSQPQARVDMPLVRHTSLNSNSSILNDVYVKLYLARLRRATLVIERIKQELLLSIKKRDRAEILYSRNATSADDLEERRRDAEIFTIRVQEAEADAEEAETFVDIAVSRISIGLEMPICAEIR